MDLGIFGIPEGWCIGCICTWPIKDKVGWLLNPQPSSWITEIVDKIENPNRVMQGKKFRDNDSLFRHLLVFFRENFRNIDFTICETIDQTPRFLHAGNIDHRTKEVFRDQEVPVSKLQFTIDISHRHSVTFYLGNGTTSDIESDQLFRLFETKGLLDTLEDKLNHIYEAYNDHLTELYNQKYIENAARNNPKNNQESAEESSRYSVIMIDLNDFKQYNDTYGHLMGDDRLKDMARILRSSVRSAEGDQVCRKWGDEFVILVHSSDRAVVEHIIARIQGNIDDFNEKMAEEFNGRMVEGLSNPVTTYLPLSASFGYALSMPEIALKETIHEADMSMFKHKIENGGGSAIYRLLERAVILSEVQKVEMIFGIIANMKDSAVLMREIITQMWVASILWILSADQKSELMAQLKESTKTDKE